VEGTGSPSERHQLCIIATAFEQEALPSMIWANQAQNTGRQP